MAHTKNLIISSRGVKLGVNNDQLTVSTKESKTHYIIADLNAVVLNNASLISGKAIQELLSSGVSLMLLGKKMMPVYFGRSLGMQTLYAQNLNIQFKNSNKQQERLWKNIVKNKINNQEKVLIEFSDTKGSLLEFSNNITVRDSTNREAVSAYKYFQVLLNGEGRRSDGVFQSSMNLGYTLLRGLFIRSLMLHGLEPSLGVFHSNKVNNHALADDLMEPFRPFIDRYICTLDTSVEKDDDEHINQKVEKLKPLLYEVLNLKYQDGKDRIMLTTLIDRFILSYRDCLLHDSIKLLKVDVDKLIIP